MVFVQRSTSGPTSLAPVDRAEGFRRLIGDFMFHQRPMTLQAVAWLVHEIEQIGFFTLRVCDFEEAAELVSSLSSRLAV